MMVSFYTYSAKIALENKHESPLQKRAFVLYC